MSKASIEQVIRAHLTEHISEPDLVEAVMLMHGWLDGRDHSPANVAQLTGIAIDELRRYRHPSDLGLAGMLNPSLVEALDYINSHLPMAHEEVLYHLSCELGVLHLPGSGVLPLMNAADAYGQPVEFKSVSRDLHKWFVDPLDTSIVDFAERWIGDLVRRVERDCIVHLAQIQKLLETIASGFTLRQIWQVIDACPQLSTGTYPYIFAREPNREQPLLRRIDRLLSWCNPHPLSVGQLFSQVFRDQSRIDILDDSGVGISHQQAFTGFLIQCSYYDVDMGGVFLNDQFGVNHVSNGTERRAVEHLQSEVGEIDIDDVEEFARAIRCPVLEVQRVLHGSPLIVTVGDSTFRALEWNQKVDEPSPWEDSNRFPFWQVSIPPPSQAPTGRTTLTTPSHREKLQYQIARHDKPIDLAKLTWESWIGIFPGDLTENLVSELEANNQKWTPILDPRSRRCVGVVKTSRLRNKLMKGNKHIALTDAKIRGVELNRYVSRLELNEAFSDSFCVFFNDGPNTWDVVFPRHVHI